MTPGLTYPSFSSPDSNSIGFRRIITNVRSTVRRPDLAPHLWPRIRPARRRSPFEKELCPIWGSDSLYRRPLAFRRQVAAARCAAQARVRDEPSEVHGCRGKEQQCAPLAIRSTQFSHGSSDRAIRILYKLRRRLSVAETAINSDERFDVKQTAKRHELIGPDVISTQYG